MRTFFAACSAACILAGAGSAHAATVIFQQSGAEAFVNVSSVSLPGPGTYRFEATSDVAAFFTFTAGYEDHWDVFLAPPPRPHHENIEGNNAALVVDEYANGLTATWEFTVPKTGRTFFGAPAHYADYGIAPGTPVYLEVRADDPYFSFFAEADTLDGTPIGYQFTVTQLTAVPEPGTWTMMIVGFGAAGAMLRTARRRGARVFA